MIPLSIFVIAQDIDVEDAVVFYEVQNVNDEPTRLYARYKEMLFLSQDHSPIYGLGFRYKF